MRIDQLRRWLDGAKEKKKCRRYPFRMRPEKIFVKGQQAM